MTMYAFSRSVAATIGSAEDCILCTTASPAWPPGRGTGGDRNTPTGRLAHGPSLSGQDATLPVVPDGGVQAPGSRGTAHPEPTLDSTDERAESPVRGGSVDQAPALGARSPEPTFLPAAPSDPKGEMP